ncbi:transposase [Mycolicibacterium boenickei]
MCSLKGVSARHLRPEFPAHIRKYLWGGHFWSPSFFAGSCGGAPLAVVKDYIENQKRPNYSKVPALRADPATRMRFIPALNDRSYSQDHH